MKASVLQTRLLEALQARDLIETLETLTEELMGDGLELSAVNTILHFLEEHPDVDFGMPGPLVHFVEQAYGAGYESELIQSVTRQPTKHTTWMLNRVINGTKNAQERVKLIDVMRLVVSHPRADVETKQQAAHFLTRL